MTVSVGGCLKSSTLLLYFFTWTTFAFIVDIQQKNGHVHHGKQNHSEHVRISGSLLPQKTNNVSANCIMNVCGLHYDIYVRVEYREGMNAQSLFGWTRGVYRGGAIVCWDRHHYVINNLTPMKNVQNLQKKCVSNVHIGRMLTWPETGFDEF